MIWALIPRWIKLSAAALVVAVIVAGGSYAIGKREGRSRAAADAAIAAIDRINNLEKQNASFRNLDERHRCILFMRDSGLPESTCDER